MRSVWKGTVDGVCFLYPGCETLQEPFIFYFRYGAPCWELHAERDALEGRYVTETEITKGGEEDVNSSHVLQARALSHHPTTTIPGCIKLLRSNYH